MSWHIEAMAVLPEYQGQGLGKQFIEIAKVQGRDNGFDMLSLHVFEANEGARRLYERCGFKTVCRVPEARMETLSGGNVQRTVLARELSEEVDVLIVQNPCFGLDLNAVAEIRNQIMKARNAGAAVLLISEDLDEILELADRIVVMFEGWIVYKTSREAADVHVIGRHMASYG